MNEGRNVNVTYVFQPQKTKRDKQLMCFNHGRTKETGGKVKTESGAYAA